MLAPSIYVEYIALSITKYIIQGVELDEGSRGDALSVYGGVIQTICDSCLSEEL